jgi:3-phosphoglycerate kinase
MRSCRDVPNGSTVFLRTGMDVPLDNGHITDPSRIEETRPTIDVLRTKGCRIVVATHIGRPKGIDPALSAKPVADYLAQFYPVTFVPAVFGDKVTLAITGAPEGNLIVIENLRYDEREEKNDAAFAQLLVEHVNVIVQDAYANCHREHASMTGVLQYKPAYTGLLVEKELSMMERLVQPEHPYVAIIGGAKADKLSTIKGMLDKVDVILVGGVLANTFLKAANFPVGESKVDGAGLVEAAELYKSGKIILPVDAVVAERFVKDSTSWTTPIGDLKTGMILDIGPDTVARYSIYLKSAKTIVWGGPIGVFEWPAFAQGTKAIAQLVAESGAYTVAAGGDSGAALVALGYKDRVSHVSTGGGVTLQLLEGKPLPVVVALEKNEQQFPTKEWDGHGADCTC